MGAIGKCCCEPCEPCELYEIGDSWSIAELIHGDLYSGTLTEFRESDCDFRGFDCQTEANVLYDTCSQQTAWTDWVNLWSCGPCVNCETGLPPAPCPVDINGDPVCPPSYPTYTRVDTSSRQAVTVKYWYTKQVQLVVQVQFRPGQVRFMVTIGTWLLGSSTAAFAYQTRYRRQEFLCTYNTLINSTVFNDVAIATPDPIPPCVDLYSLLSQFTTGTWCDDLTDPQPDPEGCDTSTAETVVDNPCIRLVGTACVNVPQSRDITLLRTVECCDLPGLCNELVIYDYTITQYLSEWFDCDEVPSAITLEIDETSLYAERSTTLNWSCDDFCSLADQTITLPETLTLTIG